MVCLPGLIDPHVHMREPGAIHKEDWGSGTAAALAGGFSCVLAMPNTQPPLVAAGSLQEAEAAAAAKARCDYGLFLGASVENVESAASLVGRVAGLKMYLDQTYGPLRLDELAAISAHVARWPATRPIVVHAEGRSLALPLALAALCDRPVHVAHLSRGDEITLVRLAKERGWPVTCEVTPHHLFLSSDDFKAIGPGRAEVRPRLASPADRAALWANLAVIDCFASDHAPHTLAEKDGQAPPPGFPGLETALPLFLSAVREGRLTLEDLRLRMNVNPQRIFHLALPPETEVRCDADARWTVHGKDLETRCAWTPFEGWQVYGRVLEVRLRGQVVYRDGKVLAPPGSGRNCFGPPASQARPSSQPKE